MADVLGYTRAGIPVYPIAGAQETTVETTETTTETETVEEPAAGSKEAVLADLARERDKRQAAEKDAKRAKELEAELAKYKEATQSETEKAIEKARKEARAEAMTEVLKDRVQDRIRAAAGGKLQDPEDAVAHLKPEDFIDKGEIDSDGIKKAVESLLKDKPYLSAQKPGKGDADQGARGPSKPDMNSLLRAAVTGSET